MATGSVPAGRHHLPPHVDTSALVAVVLSLLGVFVISLGATWIFTRNSGASLTNVEPTLANIAIVKLSDTPSPSSSPSSTSTSTSTRTPTKTATASATPSATLTSSSTATETLTATPTDTATPTSTDTPTSTATRPRPTRTPAPTETETEVPTDVFTDTPVPVVQPVHVNEMPTLDQLVMCMAGFDGSPYQVSPGDYQNQYGPLDFVDGRVVHFVGGEVLDTSAAASLNVRWVLTSPEQSTMNAVSPYSVDQVLAIAPHGSWILGRSGAPWLTVGCHAVP
ncbi:MAG TPA: hypothetical protein VLI92_00535 [Candidatus Saccharimonadales bacterium]|nr:hypothetical protein [Candidatus Saccharimonadales bacterium]